MQAVRAHLDRETNLFAASKLHIYDFNCKGLFSSRFLLYIYINILCRELQILT